MRLLVTGGAGFIGSHFVENAVAKGDTVVVLDALTYAGHRENLSAAHGAGSFRLEVGSIGDAALVRSLFAKEKFDGVVHFAAESHVDRSISGPAEFLQTNIMGTAVLLEAALEYWRELEPAKKSAFRFVQVSTDEVFGSLGPTGKFSETTPIAPNSPYSASKAAADHLARAWFKTFGLPTVTTHCSNNYGPRQFPEKLIPHMIHCALNGKALPVYGRGANVRDWIHVLDHCQGVRLALEKGKPGEIYCFGGNTEVVNLDLVKRICSILDRLSPRADQKPHADAIQFVTDRLGHDERYAIDDSLVRRELGYKPRQEFSQGLEQTVSWYLANQDWCRKVLEKGTA